MNFCQKSEIHFAKTVFRRHVLTKKKKGKTHYRLVFILLDTSSRISQMNIKQLKNRKLACLEHSNQGNMLL